MDKNHRYTVTEQLISYTLDFKEPIVIKPKTILYVTDYSKGLFLITRAENSIFPVAATLIPKYRLDNSFEEPLFDVTIMYDSGNCERYYTNFNHFCILSDCFRKAGIYTVQDSAFNILLSSISINTSKCSKLTVVETDYSALKDSPSKTVDFIKTFGICMV